MVCLYSGTLKSICGLLRMLEMMMWHCMLNNDKNTWAFKRIFLQPLSFLKILGRLLIFKKFDEAYYDF